MSGKRGPTPTVRASLYGVRHTPPDKKQGLLILTPGVAGPGCPTGPVRVRVGLDVTDRLHTPDPHRTPPSDKPRPAALFPATGTAGCRGWAG